jgi:hypothetical protein
LYTASKDAINARRREIYAQKKASLAVTLQTNNGSVLSGHENLLDGDDDSWLRRNSSYTRSENVVPGKYIIKFIIRECFFLTLLLILTEDACRHRQLENARSKDKRKYECRTNEVRSSINDRRRSKRNGDAGMTIQLPMLPLVYSD